MFKENIILKDFPEIIGAYSHGLKVDIRNSEMIFVTG